MSCYQGLPRITGKLLLSGISIITKVAGVDTLWVVMAMIDGIPRGVTGASFAIRSINWASLEEVGLSFF